MIRSLGCLIGILAIITLAGTLAYADDFNLSEHIRVLEDEPCSVCHGEEPKKITPEPTVCENCHDEGYFNEVKFHARKTHGPFWPLKHRTAAKLKTPDCSSCHAQRWCLDCHKAGFASEQGQFGNSRANVHRSDFQVTHPIAARTDPQLCTSCHAEVEFCADCHNRFTSADLALTSHRRGFRDINIGSGGLAHRDFKPNTCVNCHPNSVLPAHEWSRDHAREARKNLVTCQSCHPQGNTCLTCHSTLTGLGINPHPDGWGKIKGGLEKATNGRTCRKCH